MTRKYGQRGYLDRDRRRDQDRPAPRAEAPPPRHALDRPRGRGLGAPTENVFRCAVCGGIQGPPAASDLAATCEKCGTDLHTCTCCTSFDTAARWECRRWPERLGPVAKKGHRNDCLLFTPKVSVEFGQEKPSDPDDPRAAFDALFKL